MNTQSLLLVSIGILALVSCSPSPDPADLVVLGGRIVTMDEKNPEVDALAARGQDIVAVGAEAEVRRFIGPDTEVIDLGGALAVPGLIEGHGHFLSLGQARMQLDLTTAADWDEIVAMVAEAVSGAAPGQWILGRGWHQEKWSGPPTPNLHGMPVHDGLSGISPDNPVLLVHASGHAVMVNSKTMDLVGIGQKTPDPPGGEIVRNVGGSAIGILLETAAEQVQMLAADNIDQATLTRAVELASAECLSKGITSFQDAGSPLEAVEFLGMLAESGRLDLRLWVMLSDPNEVLAQRLSGFRVRLVGNGMLTVGGIKRVLDGALGSRSAWLLEPYEDLEETTGINIVTVEELRETARLALEYNLQLCTHAIGDRANRETLDVYQEAIVGAGGTNDLRWRVEHAQHLHPDDIPRFGELGVIAAMQPVHCTSDGPWVPKRLGETRSREGAYVWRSLLDSGAVIASGTDVPVEDVDPIPNFHAAVTRLMNNGEVFYKDQRLTPLEALRSMTLDAAFAVFEEDIKGSLEVGKLADITVLSKDILTIPAEEIPSVVVRYTIVGGAVKYRGR
jgi:predicted amidohydrolase YtcJ